MLAGMWKMDYNMILRFQSQRPALCLHISRDLTLDPKQTRIKKRLSQKTRFMSVGSDFVSVQHEEIRSIGVGK